VVVLCKLSLSHLNYNKTDRTERRPSYEVMFKYKKMKEQIFKVDLYHGGEMDGETKYTHDIDKARYWVSIAEHGTITNNQNITIQ
jgi:hypothetical protein